MYQDKLEALQRELGEIEGRLATSSPTTEQAKLTSLSRRHTELREILDVAEQVEQLTKQLTDAQAAAAQTADQDLQALGQEEVHRISKQLQAQSSALETLLVPADPNDRKNILVEIRAGAGGDEAALFAAELFRMYARFAERQGWKTNLLTSSHTGIGGLKEVIFEIVGQQVYRWLKHESGVHRVQRVPDTEKSGRVHTSTVTVAVVPEAEEQELVIDPKDLKIIASTSSGAGGQSVNTTYSAIRMTHIPTGITVSMQDERSQTQNRIKAMSVMRSRLLAKQEEEHRQSESAMRKSQIGSGDRSEKIRTYNFPQDRITDHRIKFSSHGIQQFLDGQLHPLIEQLQAAETAQRQQLAE